MDIPHRTAFAKTRIIMHRVGFNVRFEDRKITKFFPQNLKKQVDGELLTFKMPHIRNHHPVTSIKKLMIFNIRSDIKVGPGRQSLGNQETASATANGYRPNPTTRQPRMPDDRH